jgi:hypothetical protein
MYDEIADKFISLHSPSKDKKPALLAYLHKVINKDKERDNKGNIVTAEYIYNSYEKYYYFWNMMYKNVQPNFIRKDEKLIEPTDYIYYKLFNKNLITIKFTDTTMYLFNNNLSELIIQYNLIFNKQFYI